MPEFEPGEQPAPRPETKVVDGEEYNVIRYHTAEPLDRGFFGYGWDYTVNYEKSPHLQTMFEDIQSRIGAGASTETILQAVFDVVSDAFPNRDPEEVSDLYDQLHRQTRTPSLEDYLAAGTGHCTQTTLAAGVLLQRLENERQIAGQHSIEELRVEMPLTSGGHVWSKWETTEKEYVIDVVGRYLGDDEGHEKVKEHIRWLLEREG